MGERYIPTQLPNNFNGSEYFMVTYSDGVEYQEWGSFASLKEAKRNVEYCKKQLKKDGYDLNFG